jgi:hypothetical protein
MFSDVARVSSITKNMIMPANSSVIYNTNTNAYEYFDGVAWVPFTSSQATGEPTGFPLGSDGQIDFTSSTLNFTNNNRTFTISPMANGFFYFYHSGREFKKMNSESIQIDNTEGLHYIYYNNEGVLQKSTTFSYDIILKNVFVAIIYWDFNNQKFLYVGDERHGCTMDAHTHARIHAESGAVYVSGMTPNFIYSGNSVVDGNGNSNAHIGFGMSNGSFRDEDIIHDCTVTDFNINMPIFFRTSPSVWRRREGGESLISYRLMFDNATSRILYNKKVGNTFTLESPTSGNFVLYHIYAINDANINKSIGVRDNKYILIAGTQEYTSKNDARYNAINEISEMENFPFIESVAIGTIIYEHNSSYTNIAKSRLVSIDGNNFIDWRKKINLKPLTALANSHNYHGGIYGQAPYYHSNQPIGTTDDVTFKTVTSTGNMSTNGFRVRTGASSTLTNGTVDLSVSNSLFFNFDMTTNYVASINFTNGVSGETFYLRVKNSSTSFSWGLNVKWLTEVNPINNTNGNFDTYQFVCISPTLYYGMVFSSNVINTIGAAQANLISNGTNGLIYFNATGGVTETIDRANATTGDIDVSLYATNCFRINNPGFLNLTNGVEGRWYTLLVVSDGAYSFGTNCRFPLENAQPIPSASGRVDIYSFVCTNGKFLSTFAYGYTGVY